jgi:signal transduction histidine kinase
MVNLLSNALKFTSFGEIRLDVDEIAVSNKKNTTLKFSVKDTGLGIKVENKRKYLIHSYKKIIQPIESSEGLG